MSAGKQLQHPRLIKGNGDSRKVYIVTHGRELEGLPLYPTRKYLATEDFETVRRELGDVLDPGSTLLAKVGSIVSHVDEMLGDGGHRLDETAIKGLLSDQEVSGWLREMGELGLLPVKR